MNRRKHSKTALILPLCLAIAVLAELAIAKWGPDTGQFRDADTVDAAVIVVLAMFLHEPRSIEAQKRLLRRKQIRKTRGLRWNQRVDA